MVCLAVPMVLQVLDTAPQALPRLALCLCSYPVIFMCGDWAVGVRG